MNTFSYHILQPKKEVRSKEELIKQTRAASYEPQLLAIRNATTSFELWKAVVTLEFQYRAAFTTELFDGSIPHLSMVDVKTAEPYRSKLKCVVCQLLPHACVTCRTCVYWLRTCPGREEEALEFLSSLYHKVYLPSQSYVDYKHSIDQAKDRVVALPRVLPTPLTTHQLSNNNLSLSLSS